MEDIAYEVGIENGKKAEQLWGNLKKLLSKRRAHLREVDVSGAAFAAVAKARRAVEEFDYLSWLFPSINLRTTKSNISPLPQDASDESLRAMIILVKRNIFV